MRPPHLNAGDFVGLVAPGRKISGEVVQKAERVFQSWNLSFVKTPGLISEQHSYHGASSDERARDFQGLLDNPEIKAIVCARGGYGTSQFIDQLNWDKFKQNPKWIVGFSDITALHLQIHRLGIESIHCLMPIQFENENQQPAQNRLKDILFGDYAPLIWQHREENRNGECNGQLIGGNLSLVVDSLATSNEIHTFGQILFIEEVDEPFYKVDRMMNQLKRAKKLDKIKGLIVGYCTDIKDTDLSYGHLVEEIILSKINASIPVAFGCPSGHEAPNFPWIHGAKISLRVGKEGCAIHYVA
jgi:muramoyltetrapeptide carboxypeptidase